MPEEPIGINYDVGSDNVGRIVIDRPDVGNSLSPLARDALADVLISAHADPGVRAVLLASTGSRHFCTGAGLASAPADTSRQLPPDRRPGDIARQLAHGWQRLVGAVLDCDKPVVAAFSGTALGGGASLVLACDLVVMGQQSALVEGFVHRGIVPDSGAVHLLTRIVGLRKATELLMLGQPVDAEECLRLGLVNRVVPADEVHQAADALAVQLAAGPSVMLALTKRLLAVSAESPRERGFEQEAWAAELNSRTADLHEGLQSFAERRSPRFRGR
ncbi:enoyl-CoA hydratase/isomerase family protein [Mycolicibacter hiberniae]|uniref:enoyl-CoA hydratase/isomerase family protein n=1 Tax=Mycolicibacter hiberniae TaxID=29314 RepID=UPI000A15F1C3|nr:enoyl-CoA hydratase-related protein [Mycolicibacter hiberniae]MCV7087103.1 enoyl-CoA hydratase/isomerase family protein [Mycolicibacter hiberniae]ORV67890.1 enoyl-CoA hydratase [Mycolicibacter hiberniae]